jgi:hypothetical protein
MPFTLSHLWARAFVQTKVDTRNVCREQTIRPVSTTPSTTARFGQNNHLSIPPEMHLAQLSVTDKVPSELDTELAHCVHPLLPRNTDWSDHLTATQRRREYLAHVDKSCGGFRNSSSTG